jgi:hypothetical protein
MFAAMRALALALVTALAGCTCDAPSRPAGSGGARAAQRGRPADGSAGSAGPGPAGSAGPASGSACTAETAIRVSRILTDPAHPCRGRILAAYGRMVRVGAGASGTIASTAAARGAGVLVTCRPCAGAAGAELVEPERDPPLAVRIGAPARLAGDAVPAGAARHAAHRLFGGEDFAIAAISGAPLPPGAPVPAAVSDRNLALDDPRGLAASRAPFVDVRPGAAALVLGFAADAEGGELLASVGRVLDDAEARRLIAGAGPAEAKLGYDPRTELAIAARATPGMIGGGVFDEGGRFVGVVVHAPAEPIGGVHLVRAVRATAIAARLSAALRAAPVPLRTQVLAFLP